MTRPARFLVLRGGAIGDFILTLPALRALRNRWPDAWIELIGYPHIANLALAGGLVDRVLSLDRAGMARFFSERPTFPEDQKEYLRSFDLVISYLHDPGGLVRENLLQAGARDVIYCSPIVESGHAVDHLMKPLESLAIYGEGEWPTLEIPAAQREAARQWLSERGLGSGVLAVHPGSGSPRKNWPVERFAAIARRANGAAWGSFYVIGEADRDTERDLRGYDPEPLMLKGANLVQVASILSVCRRFVGNDSGITHVAAAVGTPTVAIFGPSDPTRWGPRGPHVHILRAPNGDLAALDVESVWSELLAL